MTAQAKWDLLTDREKEIAQLISTGKNRKEIACDLKLSPKTVDVHGSNFYKKLDVHNTAQLTRLVVALENAGVIEKSPAVELSETVKGASK